MSKKELNGKVIKDQNNKTVVVLVKRRYSHPFFGKVIILSSCSRLFCAHDDLLDERTVKSIRFPGSYLGPGTTDRSTLS